MDETTFELSPSPTTKVPTLYRVTNLPSGHTDKEEWCSVEDLDELFEACSRRWPVGWDLNKLLTCVEECQFD